MKISHIIILSSSFGIFSVYLSLAGFSLSNLIVLFYLILLIFRSANKSVFEELFLLVYFLFNQIFFPFNLTLTYVFLNMSILLLLAKNPPRFQVSNLMLYSALIISSTAVGINLARHSLDASTPHVVSFLLLGLYYRNRRKFVFLLMIASIGLVTESRIIVLFSLIAFGLSLLERNKLIFVAFSPLFIIVPFWYFSNTGSDDGASIVGVSINTAGRFTVWYEILSHPLTFFGHGVSMPENLINGNWHHPHNEYLRILYGFGLLGSGTLLYLIYYLYRCYQKSGRLLYFIYILLLMLTDNYLTFNYLYIFQFI